MDRNASKEATEVSEDLKLTSSASTSKEKRFNFGIYVRNAIIGFADGLTVPFALTAGLSAFGSSKIVVAGGLAELFAGAISMGLGAYLATATERESYDTTANRQRKELVESPQRKQEEICQLLETYGVSREVSDMVAEGLRLNPDMQIQFVMDNMVKMEKASLTTAMLEGLVMGISYLIGGLLPLVPYFALNDVYKALFVSIGVTVFILLGFGYVKAIVTGTTQRGAIVSAFQTLFVGAAAAAASYGIVRGLNSAEIHLNGS